MSDFAAIVGLAIAFAILEIVALVVVLAPVVVLVLLIARVAP